MQFSDFWIGKIQSDKLPEAIDAAGLIKYLSIYTSDEQCFHIIFQWHETTLKRPGDWWFPRHELLKVIQAKINKKGLTDTLRLCLELLDTSEKKSVTAAVDKVNIEIDILLRGGPELLISRRDPLGILIIAFLSNIKSVRQQQYWTAFIKHCLTAGDAAIPNPKWWEKAKELVGRLNADHFIMKLQDWISFSQAQLISAHQEKGRHFSDYHIDFLSPINHNMLKALIWCCAIPDNKVLPDMLESYVPWAYKKKGTGPLSARTGTACIYAFTFLPCKEALRRIIRFRALIRHAGTLKTVDKILHDVAGEHAIPLHELEEYVVPDFGLDKGGTLRVQAGDLTGIYTLHNTGKSDLYWEKDGQRLKSVRQQQTPAVKALKQLAREIDDTLSGSSARLERSFLRLHPWSYSHWKTYYLEHPLLKILTTRLLWNFQTNGTDITAFYLDGQLVDHKGKAIKVTEDTTVSLWHPINAPVKIVRAWRNFLAAHQVDQPFDQVNRVIYAPTAEELADGFFSSRFAAQVLNSRKFKTVIRQRGWTLRQKAVQNWSYMPHMALTDWDIRVNFFADRQQEDTVVTDMINFYKEGEPLPLRQVPPVVFSEMIRDVSFFVTAAGSTELHNRS
jgi:hypothetical protein